MLEIRFHGRGGQGAVIASKILAVAVFSEGKQVQAFPTFGVERRGAPVMAFVRIDDKPIPLRHQIYKPDHIIIMDPTLINYVNVFEGLKPGGFVLINTTLSEDKFLPITKKYRLAIIDAFHIAAKHRLGTPSYPIVNTTILGAVNRILNLCSMDNLKEAIKESIPVKPEANAMAAQEAYELVKIIN